MPLFTVERQYLVPVYEHLTIEAADAEAACRAAVDEDAHPWDDPKTDYELARETCVSGVWAGDDLQWFRVFSLSPRPRRTLSRRDLQVSGRRLPKGSEAMSLLKGATVVELRSAGKPVEIALGSSAMTGFLAWLEAQPPGATLPD